MLKFKRKLGSNMQKEKTQKQKRLSTIIDCSEMKENDKWPFYDHFWPFFWQLYDHISQN